jgi:hypothetical protein
MIPSPDARPELIGREADIDVLRPIADAPDGKALVVTGGPGVGKSALLDEAAAIAHTVGHRAIRAAGVEFAVKVSFGGLNQLLLPLQPLAGQLGTAPREALSSRSAAAAVPALTGSPWPARHCPCSASPRNGSACCLSSTTSTGWTGRAP